MLEHMLVLQFLHNNSLQACIVGNVFCAEYAPYFEKTFMSGHAILALSHLTLYLFINFYFNSSSLHTTYIDCVI